MPVQIRKRFTGWKTAAACMYRHMTSYRGSPAEEPDALKALLIADMHTDADPWRDRSNVMRRYLTGATTYCGDADVLVLAGDNTNSAHEREYTLLRRLLRRYCVIPQILPAMGNHDTRGTSIDPDFEEATRLFRALCKECGISASQNYFRMQIKGFWFIALGSERLLKDDAYLSPTQLQWLDESLTKAKQSGKPVFVVCHQPPYGRNGADEHWPGDGPAWVGEQSAELEAILLRHGQDKRQPIIYISGHLHQTPCKQTFQKASEGLYYLNLPEVLSKKDLSKAGEAFSLYADQTFILLQGINLISGQKSYVHKYIIIL